MKCRNLFFGILIMVFLSCSSDDSSTEPQTQNQPPGVFSLLQVMDNETDVDLFPTFTWNFSTDPDGDAVYYDLYLGLNPDPQEKVISAIATNTFTAKTKLNWARQYFWKVVAKDGKGGERASEVFSFNTRPVKVTKIEPTVNFTERMAHNSVVYNNKMWVISGIGSAGYYNNVWSSTDGIIWERQELPINGTPPFHGRFGHATVVYNNNIWVIAGHDLRPPSEKEIWRGGATVADWEFMGNAQFSGRRDHTSVVFDNKIWVIGGFDNSGTQNDVWSSEDGIIWNEVSTEGSIFSQRLAHRSAVFNNKLWVIGGYDGEDKNDVWSSEDGITWNEVLSNAPFSPRPYHEVIVFDQKLWVIGGDEVNRKNDIWYSEDGRNWIDATPQNSFTPVSSHTTVVFDNKIWILGGANDNGFTNDIWTLE